MARYGLETWILAILFVALVPGSVWAEQSPSKVGAEVSEYQKEALTAIKELTTNLLFLGIGVFALVGGYLSKDQPVTFNGRRWLLSSFGLYGISLLAGLFLFMVLINQLQANEFDAKSVLLRTFSVIQIVSIMVASGLFFVFLVKNVGKNAPSLNKEI